MCEKRDFNRVNRTITTVAPIVYNLLIKIYTIKNVLGQSWKKTTMRVQNMLKKIEKDLSEVGFEPTPSVEDQNACNRFCRQVRNLSLAP